jgi:hypothetical protein
VATIITRLEDQAATKWLGVTWAWPASMRMTTVGIVRRQGPLRRDRGVVDFEEPLIRGESQVHELPDGFGIQRAPVRLRITKET